MAKSKSIKVQRKEMSLTSNRVQAFMSNRTVAKDMVKAVSHARQNRSAEAIFRVPKSLSSRFVE